MNNFFIRLASLLLICFLFVSCGKMDDLDGLEGQWQLTEWTEANGEKYAGKEIQIYYRFQLGLIDFHKVSLPDGFSHACFENRNGVIRIHSPYEYAGNGHSKMLPMSTLSMYGVPEDGMMKIEELTSNRLVLSNPVVGTLSFRKY